MDESVGVVTVMSETSGATHKHKLAEMLAEVGPSVRWQDKDQLLQLLLEHHTAFAVHGERGDTDLVQMSIETGSNPEESACAMYPVCCERGSSRAVKKIARQRSDTAIVYPMGQPSSFSSQERWLTVFLY